jgi:hypothetical protein
MLYVRALINEGHLGINDDLSGWIGKATGHCRSGTLAIKSAREETKHRYTS